MKLLTICFVILSACGCAIKRPDAYVGVVNAPSRHLKGYNLLKDYDTSGNLKPSAKAEFRDALSVQDLNKYICTDPDGYAAIIAYAHSIKREYDNLRAQCPAGK